MSRTRFVIPTVLALTAALCAGAAQAHDADVRWSVTIGSPVVAVPAPVYVQPQPVYAVPAPYYPYYRVAAYRLARHYAPTYWDRDGDGIPNRYDRVYNPPWDRDGDGIPDRYEHRNTPRWDRDGDGVPNRYDRHPRDGWRP